MTMLISPELKIAGVKALVLRDLLRKSEGSFRRDWLQAKLGLNKKKATDLADSLVTEGYLQCDQVAGKNSEIPWYTVTSQGKQLMMAKASKRIDLTKAELLLRDFIERVHHVNSDDSYRCSVTKAVVFGSFLKGTAHIADLDLAVDLEDRLDPGQELSDMCFAHADRSGRHFPNITAQLYWPHTEVLLFLKARNRYIHLQPWYAFIGMRKEAGFIYKVLLGDKASIQNELEAPSKSEHPAVNRRVVSLDTSLEKSFLFRHLRLFHPWRDPGFQSGSPRPTWTAIMDSAKTLDPIFTSSPELPNRIATLFFAKQTNLGDAPPEISRCLLVETE